VNVCSGKTVQITKSKVVIIGTSHFKGSVLRIANYLSAKFEVGGFIKPGAGLESTVGKIIIDSFRLTKNYVLVFSGGVNDVYNKNSKMVILQIMKFLQDSNTNRLMVDILHRYNFSDNSM
jgi:hypothetical protein